MRARALSLGAAGISAALIAATFSAPAQAAGERRAAPVQITGSNTAFSPNGDGSKDVGTVSYKLVKPGRVTATIAKGGKTVRTVRLGSKAKGNGVFRWNGKRANGKVVPDGKYTVTLSSRGTKARTPLVVDARYSEAVDLGTMRLSSNRLYPTTTVIKDVVVGVFFPSQSKRLYGPQVGYERLVNNTNRVQGDVLNAAGTKVADAAVSVYQSTYDNAEQCGYEEFCVRMTWDGRDAKDELLPFATYTIRPWMTDDSGNPRTLTTTLPTVTTVPTQLEERTTSVTTTAQNTPIGTNPYRDPKAQPSELDRACGGPEASNRFAGGLSFANSRVNVPPNYVNFECRDFSVFAGQLPARRTPYDAIEVSATGGPATPGAAGKVVMYVGGNGNPVELTGDTTVPLKRPFRAFSEVPGRSEASAAFWTIASDSTEAYDISSFTYKLTQYVPAS